MKGMIQMVGFGGLAAILVALTVSGQMAAAASGQAQTCSIALSGNLDSLKMASAGSWTLSSSACNITSRSNGMSGTFTGNLTSTQASGIVSGTWSVSGADQNVVASSTTFTLSVSVDQSLSSAPMLSPTVQGTLSGAAIQTLVAVQTSGQVTLS